MTSGSIPVEVIHRQYLQTEEDRREYGSIWTKYGVGIALCLARQDIGLTQEQAAAKAGVSQAYLSKLESGEANPTIGQVGKLLAAWGLRLNVSVGPLLDGAETRGTEEDSPVQYERGQPLAGTVIREPKGPARGTRPRQRRVRKA